DDHGQHEDLDARRDHVAQHALGGKGGLAEQPERVSTKPASVVSLNSMRVIKRWMARIKKASSTRIQANSSSTIWMKFSMKPTYPISPRADSRSGRPASRPTCAIFPGLKRSAEDRPVPE